MGPVQGYIPLGSGFANPAPKKRGKEFSKVHQSLWSRLRFKGGVYSISSYDYDFGELLEWIKEDCDKTIYLQDMKHRCIDPLKGYYRIKFRTEEAAMAFKLRWL